MKTVETRHNQVILVLSKIELKTLYDRLKQSTGVVESQPLKRAKSRIHTELHLMNIIHKDK